MIYHIQILHTLCVHDVCMYIVCLHTSLEAFCYNWEALPCKRGGVRIMLDILQFVFDTIVNPLILCIIGNYLYDNLKQR